MSQRSQYVYVSVPSVDFGGWPDGPYGWVNSDKIIMLRVTPVTVDSSTQYYPELVVEDFTETSGAVALFATAIGNGTATVGECENQILAWLQSGGAS